MITIIIIIYIYKSITGKKSQDTPKGHSPATPQKSGHAKSARRG